MKKLLYLLLIVVATINAKAQQYIPYFLQQENDYIRSNSKEIHNSGWVVFKDEANVLPNTLPSSNKSILGFTQNDNYTLVKSETDNYPFTTDQNRMTHNKYQQTYKGINVEGGEYLEHVKSGKVKVIHAKIVNGLTLSIVPNVTENSALTAALKELGATNIYAWLDSNYENSLKIDLNNNNATYYPVGKLVLTYIGTNTTCFSPSDYKLAWRFDIESLSPSLHNEVYVDAQNNAILHNRTLRKYDGWADLSAQGLGNRWLDTRSRGWPYYDYVLNADNGRDVVTKKRTFSAWNLVAFYDDGNDDWDYGDFKETIAHFGVNNAYDYFINKFSYYSTAGIGNPLRIWAESGDETHYAPPNSGGTEYIHFGFGGLNNAYYLAGVDVAGHEFTHGIIEHHCKLDASGEAGSLAESFGDIFGQLAESYGLGNALNWKEGVSTGAGYRDFASPENSTRPYDISTTSTPIYATAQPKYYHDINWYYGDKDLYGAHINDGVNNHWFYLIVNGFSINNVSYQGIGTDNAAKIVFLEMNNYLIKTSQYVDAVQASLNATENLFGICSVEYNTVWNAWVKVGLLNTPIPNNGISISGPNGFISTLINSSSYPIQYIATNYVGNQVCNWTYPSQWNCQVTGQNNSILNILNFNGYFPSTTSISVSTTPCAFAKTKYISFYDKIILSHDANDNTKNKFSTGEIIINPNPSSSNILITAIGEIYNPETLWKIKVLNYLGINLLENSSNFILPYNIDITSLQTGSYFLELTNSNSETLIIPFIKN